MSDCPKHKIRLETKIGNYKTQQFITVEPFCTICKKTTTDETRGLIFND